VEWIYLAMDKVQWCAVVNTVMNLQVLGQLSTLSSIQEGLYSLELIVVEMLPWCWCLVCSIAPDQTEQSSGCHIRQILSP
jgi:hypothetical protein